jgi:hypothetical protein
LTNWRRNLAPTVLEDKVATQQDVHDSGMDPVGTRDMARAADSADMTAPEGYLPPDADVAESLPPQCSF